MRKLILNTVMRISVCEKGKKHHDDGAAEEVVFRGKEKLKVDTYLPVLDMLCTELLRRLKAYREINNLFGFPTDFSTKSDAEIRQDCTKFKEHYFEDIEPEFINEMMQGRRQPIAQGLTLPTTIHTFLIVYELEK
ncbi:hypothetical protein EVAR_16666_1 [Eumeta japonica]|uniref:Uncharacterized protein n=1 Tax=Eumeta variegata TaxID=151549 RepID=A0A4C1UZJ5_EUMVA|nr:hypothetical protein EVAR_16666_1 [Eumeta japonica]